MRTQTVALAAGLVLVIGIVIAVLATRGGGGGGSGVAATHPPTSTSRGEATPSSALATSAAPAALEQALLRTAYPPELFPPGWGYQATWADGHLSDGPAPFLPAEPGDPFHFVGHALIGFQSTTQPSRQLVLDFEVLGDNQGAEALVAAVNSGSGAASNGGVNCTLPSAQTLRIGYCQQRVDNTVIVAAPDAQLSYAQQVADTDTFLAHAQTYLSRVKVTIG